MRGLAAPNARPCGPDARPFGAPGLTRSLRPRRWPSVTYTIEEGRLCADWPAAFGPADGVARFEWSVGTDAGLDDTSAWAVTDGPHINAPLRLDPQCAHYLNVRAVFADGSSDEVSSRAQPMFGEACAHRRFVLRGERVGLTRGEGQEGLRAFFAHAEALQAEDAAEAAAAADGEEDAAAAAGGDAGDDAAAGEAAPGGSRHDSHVDTPELAAEALLDAACVLLKQRCEDAFRRNAAARHAAALAAGAAADAAEAALRCAYQEVAVAARQAALLAELEAEAEAKAARAKAPKKKSKKAKAPAPAPEPEQQQPQAEPQPQPAEQRAQAQAQPEASPQRAPPEALLTRELAALAPFPAAAAAARRRRTRRPRAAATRSCRWARRRAARPGSVPAATPAAAPPARPRRAARRHPRPQRRTRSGACRGGGGGG
jgi:hypothetical protein